MRDLKKKFMTDAIRLASRAINKEAGGPFGCVIIKDGKIIARGNNSVTAQNDPTAHAEVVAIRKACKKLKSFQLDGCDIYTSCEPCPMCLGAIYWSRPSKVYFASTRHDASDAGFDDDFIYHELSLETTMRKIPFEFFPLQQALDVFEQWKVKPDKIHY